jgi:diguanylate cyclase (GGDEF)-like protein
VVMGLPTLVAPGSVGARTAYDAAFGALVVFAWLGVRRRAGQARIAHLLVASALTSWFGGDLVYAAQERWSGEPGDVSPADFFWVAGYVLVAAGLVIMVRLRAPGRLREAALDALAMTTAVTALFWQFMIRPELDGTMSMAVVFATFYPLGDVMLFAVGVLIVLAPGRRVEATGYLLAALAVSFAGDVLISVTSLTIPAFDNGRLDCVLLAGIGLFAAALWHPDAGRMTETRPSDRDRVHPARLIFLGVALLTLPALNLVRPGVVAIDQVTVLVAMVLLTVIVLLRFALVVREQERARDALAYRASHDQLTGAVNRQELHARLTAALLRGAPAVHFLDLNGFKPINDRYGHAAGDFVLIEVAARLCSAVRASDTVARVGGDEFVVLSDGDEDPEALAGRLRRAVTAPLRFGDREVSVGVSIGCASATGSSAQTADSLLAQADAAMYDEKRSSVSRQPVRAASSIGQARWSARSQYGQECVPEP